MGAGVLDRPRRCGDHPRGAIPRRGIRRPVGTGRHSPAARRRGRRRCCRCGSDPGPGTGRAAAPASTDRLSAPPPAPRPRGQPQPCGLGMRAPIPHHPSGLEPAGNPRRDGHAKRDSRSSPAHQPTRKRTRRPGLARPSAREDPPARPAARPAPPTGNAHATAPERRICAQTTGGAHAEFIAGLLDRMTANAETIDWWERATPRRHP
jgi:hypothetical protein